MPNALKTQRTPEVFPAEECDDDFGSMEEMAAMMVEAFTMPMASDLADTGDAEIDAKPRFAKPHN
ncbi:hypothetical protein N7E02_26835 [Aliirhizobium terrae]|uniref:hypothetical protein n=1 Tax=Terrirhizobium terrae TaxID=2926709 RepID=UPI002574DA00|nr:hypothetical protein [Rhizobium sp. CC-CFT758]WJH40193.1 hypothetical protein N7E02_26835 [Rhizobium sp. CC-CFT758]